MKRRRKRRRIMKALQERQLLFSPAEYGSVSGGRETLAQTSDQVEQHARCDVQVQAATKQSLS